MDPSHNLSISMSIGHDIGKGIIFETPNAWLNFEKQTNPTL